MEELDRPADTPCPNSQIISPTAKTTPKRSLRNQAGGSGLKRETLQGAHDYGDSDTCRRTVFAWLTRYNTRRRHSANGHLSPNEYEHHTAKLTLAA
ncbi:MULTISPECIES: IS3 family transposase [unclassified Streptomyces]|uniref:IS3 family transposase n=1 Tax=unclassified Streptomyces TaxID=2593676 RepID=UPI00224DC0CD|nr:MULTISPECIES: IS3 family transposase [unclassified Streptomyces]WSP53223.1 IS3 family transposase [Streptomyces sp. NBC_01241]MCX4792095.1 IS3 family transposase [Streptomyces sp. NBC_01221]MCX4799987.1 IS3 family transposase [Streptomyces sp. NBC_01242]WSJ40620.1 IS3 family transposase [Streptomyces sp. NBC_01321]WSP66941.1 IS3 family transposase [Streptomyces sp. NBC_01240]